MTSRDVYEAILVELNKNFGTPDLLLEDFLYFINKATFAWEQKRYNVYDTNQQTTDDVQVLKKSVTITIPTDLGTTGDDYSHSKKGKNHYFTVKLGEDYMHMLNCILELKVVTDFKCYSANETILMPAKRLTSDQESVVLNNAWLSPSYRQPYYKVESTGLLESEIGKKTPESQVTVTFGPDASYTNGTVTVTGVFRLEKLHCDYIKFPAKIKLTYSQLDTLVDTSQVMEFKDDVCYEIIKEAVKLIALNTQNPMLQGYDQINMTVPPQGGMQGQQQ